MRPVFLLLALAACEDPEPGIEVGTGEREFEPLEDGDDILIIQGPQGGFHVLGSFLVTGVEAGDTDNLFDPDNPTMHFTVREEGDRVDVSNPFIQGLDDGPGRGEHQVTGRFVFLDIEADDELGELERGG